jgi:hypothetical protein
LDPRPWLVLPFVKKAHRIIAVFVAALSGGVLWLHARSLHPDGRLTKYDFILAPLALGASLFLLGQLFAEFCRRLQGSIVHADIKMNSVGREFYERAITATELMTAASTIILLLAAPGPAIVGVAGAVGGSVLGVCWLAGSRHAVGKRGALMGTVILVGLLVVALCAVIYLGEIRGIPMWGK